MAGEDRNLDPEVAAAEVLVALEQVQVYQLQRGRLIPLQLGLVSQEVLPVIQEARLALKEATLH